MEDYYFWSANKNLENLLEKSRRLRTKMREFNVPTYGIIKNWNGLFFVRALNVDVVEKKDACCINFIHRIDSYFLLLIGQKLKKAVKSSDFDFDLK